MLKIYYPAIANCEVKKSLIKIFKAKPKQDRGYLGGVGRNYY